MSDSLCRKRKFADLFIPCGNCVKLVLTAVATEFLAGNVIRSITAQIRLLAL